MAFGFGLESAADYACHPWLTLCGNSIYHDPRPNETPRSALLSMPLPDTVTLALWSGRCNCSRRT